MKILALDDREDGRYLLTALLTGHGHEAVAAGDGEAALELLRSGGFDLVISDILMPVMDGFQFCRQVKADPALAGIPFIFYTATYTGPKDEEFAMKLGADRFVRKPCDPEELMRIVAEVTAKPRPAAPAPPPLGEEEVLRLYSERLVRKVEQKMLEAERNARELAEEKRRFQSLVDEMPLAVAVIERDGTILYLNPRVKAILGVPPERIPNLAGLLDATMPDLAAREAFDGAWRETLGRTPADPPRTLHLPMRRDDGEAVAARVHQSVLEGGHLLLTLEDVTEQTLLEARLRQAQKMEALATLAGGIAHDFNNILGAIMSFGELARAEHLPDCPAADHVADILRGAERARQLVRQIHAFSRRGEERRAPMALRDAVREVLALLSAGAPRGVTVREEPLDDATVHADPTQMHQMLMNLCTNAFHAMKQGGGTLTLSLARVAVGAHEAALHPDLDPGGYALLTVRDTGTGIAPEVATRIFDPYFTTKPEGEGTGLGLSVTHGIVKSHRGAIECESAPGEGTVFRVYLPIAEDEMA